MSGDGRIGWGGRLLTLSLRAMPGSGKNKAMPDAPSAVPPPASASRVPEIIIANWREFLNQAQLARAVRHPHAQAIEGYLDYCRLNGVSVTVESARGFIADAPRQGLTADVQVSVLTLACSSFHNRSTARRGGCCLQRLSHPGTPGQKFPRPVCAGSLDSRPGQVSP